MVLVVVAVVAPVVVQEQCLYPLHLPPFWGWHLSYAAVAVVVVVNPPKPVYQSPLHHHPQQQRRR